MDEVEMAAVGTKRELPVPQQVGSYLG